MIRMKTADTVPAHPRMLRRSTADLSSQQLPEMTSCRWAIAANAVAQQRDRDRDSFMQIYDHFAPRIVRYLQGLMTCHLRLISFPSCRPHIELQTRGVNVRELEKNTVISSLHLKDS